MHVSTYFHKKKHSKNKWETSEFGYPQGVGKNRVSGIKEGVISSNILFKYHFGFWKFVTVLFTQKHKNKPTRMEVDEKSKMEYKQKQNSITVFQINKLNTLKKNKLTQITFQRNTLPV